MTKEFVQFQIQAWIWCKNRKYSLQDKVISLFAIMQQKEI